MKNLLSRLLTLFFILALTFQLTWYALLWVSYVRDHSALVGSDFLAAYSTGQIAYEQGWSRVYDTALLRQFQERLVGPGPTSQEAILYLHPPLLLPLLWLLAPLDYTLAYILHCLVLFVLALAGLPFLFRLLREKGWSKKQGWVFLAGALLFQPLFISILKGQDTAFCLFGAILWLYGLSREDDRLAGLGLSLTLIRPQIALLLAIPFLFNRRKVFGWFCAGATVLGLLSLAMVGWSGAWDYLRVLLAGAGGVAYGLNQNAMFNFTGLGLRLFPNISIGLLHGLAWGLFAAGLAGLSVLWKLSPAIRLPHLGLAVLTGLFVAPHLHYHELTLLLLPILALAVILVERGRLRPQTSAYLPLAFSLLLLLGDISPARFAFPYLVMLFLVVRLWLAESTLGRGNYFRK